jgi:hypothetical protein
MRLKGLARRCARGEPSYDAYRVMHLKTLVRDYGLRLQAGRKVDKKQLIRCLEDADDFDARDTLKPLPKFHRFLELPPELRNCVYIFHLESLGKVPPRFVVPPLCRASRQLKLETTALFYEHCTFVVLLMTIHVPDDKAQLHYHTEIARSNIPHSAFARIKHLFIRLKEHSHRPPMANWLIDLTCGQCRGWSKFSRRHTEQSVQTLVDSIMADKGLAKLEKSDLDKLEFAITQAYVRWSS